MDNFLYASLDLAAMRKDETYFNMCCNCFLQEQCYWQNGQPLAYRNFAHGQIETTWSITQSFLSDWEVGPIEFVRTDHQRKRGVYDKNNQPNLTRYVQELSNVSLSFISERVCATIATGILTMGKWNYVYCDEQIQMPYVVCEKTRTNISLVRKRRRHIIRALYECNYRQVAYVVNKKYRCVSLKNNCLTSSLVDITFRNNAINYGYIKFLWKWTIRLTFTIGYMHLNSTHGLCLNKLQKCCYYELSRWEKGNLCSLKQTPYWWCPTNTKTTSPRCTSREFQCLDGVCILNHYHCDNIIDCLDGSDETDCSKICTSNKDCFIGCKSPECNCLYYYIQYGNRCEAVYWRYHELLSISNSNIPRVYEIQEHVFNTDLSCPSGWAQCTTGGTGLCYPNHKICVFERNIFDTPNYCSNTEHLNGCHGHQCPTQFKCKTFCIPIYMLCDGVSDCPDEEDEAQTLCVLTILLAITTMLYNIRLSGHTSGACPGGGRRGLPPP